GCGGTAPAALRSLVLELVDADGAGGGDRLDGGPGDGQGGPGVLAGDGRGAAGPGAVGEIGQLGDVGVAEEILVVADAAGGETGRAVGGQVGAAQVADGEQAGRAEDLAADVVAVDGLEAGFGGGQGAVVEADRDDRGVEQAAVLEIGPDQRVGQGEYLGGLGTGVEEAQRVEVV